MDTVREMTFEEEAKFYEEEVRVELAKEAGNGDCSGINNILRRGMRIIRKARQEIASCEVIRCKNCVNTCEGNCGLVCLVWGAGTSSDGWCYKAERKIDG